jgi:hypothetical protein
MARGFQLRWYHVLLIVILLAWAFGYIQVPGLKSPWEIKKPEEEYYYGTVTVKIAECNYFDGSAETTSSPSYIAYHSYLGPGVGGVAVAASGTDFDLMPEDKGFLYLKLNAGTGHFIAYWAIQQDNPRVAEVTWRDVDNDGRDDLIVKLDLRNIGKPGQASKPTAVVVLPLIKKAGTLSIAIDGPSAITGIGTSEKVVQITWKISDCAEKSGAPIARISVYTNRSDEVEGEDLVFEQLTLSGLGLDKTFSGPVQTEDRPYVAWYHKPTDYTEVHNGIMIYRAPNTADALYVTLNVRCRFETGDKVGITIKFEILDTAGNVVQTLTSTVGLAA